MKLLIFFFISLQILSAQKVVKKSILNEEIGAISIDATNLYEVVLATSLNNEVLVEASIEGEYKNNLVLDLAQEGRTMLVSCGFRPIFKKPNDKLSAHKVISVALKIYVPEYKNVVVNGTSCNVNASGKFQNLKITLNDGNCVLKDISESVTVKTQSGHIYVYAKSGKFDTNSKYGSVQKEQIPLSDTHFMLSSITGDINIRKTE